MGEGPRRRCCGGQCLCGGKIGSELGGGGGPVSEAVEQAPGSVPGAGQRRLVLVFEDRIERRAAGRQFGVHQQRGAEQFGTEPAGDGVRQPGGVDRPDRRERR